MQQILPQPRRRSRWYPLIVGFFVIVLGIHFLPIVWISVDGLVENRTLAKRPPFPETVAGLQQLPAEWDAYLTDEFPVRSYVISRLNYARYLLGWSGSPKIIIGRQGWLFYDDGNHLAALSGKTELSAPDVGRWVEGLQQRITYLQNSGIQFYMLLAPTKEDIYPEYRPVWMPKTRVPTEIDQFVQGTRHAGIDRLVDPRPALLEVKNRLPLWDKYDTHWTGDGAYIGYAELLRRIHRDLPDVQPFPKSYFDFIRTVSHRGPHDLAAMLGISSFTDGPRVTYSNGSFTNPARTVYLSDRHDWTAPQILLTGASGGRTLLLMRDSFSNEMVPLLAANFSKIILTHDQDGFFRIDLIKKYKPDVVVMEVIEPGARFSMDPLPVVLQSFREK